MFWKRKPETRSDTGDPVDTQYSTPPVSASSHALRGHALAVVQSCAGLIGRSLAQVGISENARAILSPDLLYQIGRDLTLAGESLSVIGVRMDGSLYLSTAHTWDVTGDQPDPQTWRYRASVSTPSGDPREAIFDASDVLHFRMNCDPAEPYRGRNPLLCASLTTGLSALTERAIGEESASDFGQLLSVTHEHEDDLARSADGVFSKWHKLTRLQGGRLVIAQQRERGTGSGQFANLTRVQFDPAQSTIALRNDLQRDLCSLYGVPQSLLFGTGDGSLARELWRQFAITTISPIANMISREATVKLEREVTVDMTSLRSSDFQGLSRAIRGLVDSGMDLESALRAVGLDQD